MSEENEFVLKEEDFDSFVNQTAEQIWEQHLGFAIPMARVNSPRQSSNEARVLGVEKGSPADRLIDAAAGQGQDFISEKINEFIQNDIPGSDKFNSDVKNALADLLVQSLSNVLAGVATGTFNVVKDKFTGGGKGKDGGPGMGGGDDGGRCRRADGSGGPHNHAHISYNSEPIEVRLDTGILPNTYGPLFQKYETWVSPLHLSFVDIQIPLTTTDLASYYNKIIGYIFQTKVQAAVSFSVNLTNFTVTTFGDALNYLFKALCVYYYYDSILSYSNNPLNRNEGIIRLRNDMTASEINNLMNLRRILAGTPIPPNMFEFAFYLNQIYQSSELPASALIKICPIPLSYTTNRPDSLYITNAIDNIQAYDDVWALLSRACPKWVRGTMPGSAMAALHDPQFCTIWANLPFYHYKKTSGATVYDLYGPQVNTTSEEILYNTYTNSLDGAAYALTGMYVNGTTLWPSFVKPIANNYVSYTDANNYQTSSRLSYYGSGTTAFKDVYDYKHLVDMRDETYKSCSAYTSNTITPANQYGTEICKSVTANTVGETAQKLLDWLMTWNSFGTLPDKREYKNLSNGRGRKSKSKGKK